MAENSSGIVACLPQPRNLLDLLTALDDRNHHDPEVARWARHILASPEGRMAVEVDAEMKEIIRHHPANDEGEEEGYPDLL